MKIIKAIIMGCMVIALVGCSSNNEKTSTAKKITLDEAKTIALKHANLEEKDIQYKETSAETDDGVYRYEIEFKDNDGKHYDYKIDGTNGEIIKFDHSFEDINQMPSTTNSFTLEQAKEKALTHAGAKASDVTFTQTKEDTDNGIKVYDIEFYDKNKSYEYEMVIETGEIASYHYSKISKSKPKNAKAVTIDEAKSIVLKDAKVTDSHMNFITAREEKEDGLWVYTLKFQNGNKTYDYEVEKSTGDILELEVN